MKFKSNLICTSLLLVIAGLLAPNLSLSKPAAAVTQSVWRPFSPPGSGFSILMPGIPEENSSQVPVNINGKILTLTQHMYANVSTQDETIYSVAYTDYPASSFPGSVEEGLATSLEFISAFVETSHPGVVQRKQMMRLNGNPGVEIKMGIPDPKSGELVTMWMRVFVVPRANNQFRSYQIIVFSAKEQSLQRTLDGFFRSFKLI